jgi:hypothetical protein
MRARWDSNLQPTGVFAVVIGIEMLIGARVSLEVAASTSLVSA